MDVFAGRAAALERDLPIIGTLGLLERAADKGLLDFEGAVNDLKSSGFFMTDRIERAFMERRINHSND